MTHFGKGGAHGAEAHKALNAWCGREDMAKSIPETRHIGLRPHHSGEEEEDDAEEHAAKDARHFLTDKEIAETHAEEGNREDEGQQE